MEVNLHEARELMRRVARQEARAAETLFERYGNMVYRYLRGCGASQVDAEDLTQDVFMHALMRAASYVGRGSLEGWLIRAARTRLVDRYREQGARRRRELEWARSSDSGEPSPVRPDIELSRAIGLLSLEDREVLVLARFLEFPGDRIAEVLGLSHGAVRVRLYRALKRLAEHYQEAQRR